MPTLGYPAQSRWDGAIPANRNYTLLPTWLLFILYVPSRAFFTTIMKREGAGVLGQFPE